MSRPSTAAIQRRAEMAAAQIHVRATAHAQAKADAAQIRADDDPTAYIVWNEDRTEGVIFVTQPPYSDPNLPSALDDARQASTGERASMFGSTMAETFYDAFDEDDDRPIQAVSYAELLALPSPPDAG